MTTPAIRFEHASPAFGGREVWHDLSLAFGEGSFEHVFVCFVLEHLKEPVAALEKLRAVLKPGGTITVIETLDTPLPAGVFEIQNPLGREYTIPISTYWGFRLTSTTVSPNAYTTVIFEE